MGLKEVLSWESWNWFCTQKQPSALLILHTFQLLLELKVNTQNNSVPSKIKNSAGAKGRGTWPAETQQFHHPGSPEAPSCSCPPEAGHEVRQTFCLSQLSHPWVIFVFQAEDIDICRTWLQVHKRQHRSRQKPNANITRSWASTLQIPRCANPLVLQIVTARGYRAEALQRRL